MPRDRPRGDRGPSPKRERPALAGTGALENNSNNTRQSGSPAAEKQVQRPSLCVLADRRDARFRRDVARLHQLGSRALYEMLAELGVQRLIRSEIEELVERYATRLTPELLHATGGDKFAPALIHVVGGSA
jgi:hypothetical protein